jgi:hypothetical protein
MDPPPGGHDEDALATFMAGLAPETPRMLTRYVFRLEALIQRGHPAQTTRGLISVETLTEAVRRLRVVLGEER